MSKIVTTKTGKFVLTMRGCDSRTGRFARYELHPSREEAERHADIARRHGLETQISEQTESRLTDD